MIRTWEDKIKRRPKFDKICTLRHILMKITRFTFTVIWLESREGRVDVSRRKMLNEKQSWELFADEGLQDQWWRCLANDFLSPLLSSNLSNAEKVSSLLRNREQGCSRGKGEQEDEWILCQRVRCSTHDDAHDTELGRWGSFLRGLLLESLEGQNCARLLWTLYIIQYRTLSKMQGFFVKQGIRVLSSFSLLFPKVSSCLQVLWMNTIPVSLSLSLFRHQQPVVTSSTSSREEEYQFDSI